MPADSITRNSTPNQPCMILQHSKSLPWVRLLSLWLLALERTRLSLCCPSIKVDHECYAISQVHLKSLSIDSATRNTSTIVMKKTSSNSSSIHTASTSIRMPNNMGGTFRRTKEANTSSYTCVRPRSRAVCCRTGGRRKSATSASPTAKRTAGPIWTPTSPGTVSSNATEKASAPQQLYVLVEQVFGTESEGLTWANNRALNAELAMEAQGGWLEYCRPLVYQHL
jgi:hypothetical protein